MSQSRRNFLKTAAATAIGTGLLSGNPLAAFARNNKQTIQLNKKMKLSFKPYDLQLRHVFTIANSSRTTTPVVLTEITYDGITGYGEASLPPYLGETQASVIEFLKKVNLEQFSSPFELEDILTYVDKITENNTAAKASIDIALHDLAGKIMGQPWYKIWGLDKEKTPSTTFTIGIDTEEVVKQKTREAAPLYNILKVKLGRDNDKQMIEAIRTVTDKPIAIDANQGWKDKHYALDMINWLKERGIVMIEQPMPKYNLDDAAWVTERSPLPIFADESFQRLQDVLRLKGAFTGVNIKLMKCTGMREAQKILTVARAANMKVMIGCMTETSCAISAATQLSPAVDWADLDGNLLISNDCFKGATVIDGKLHLEDKPGIGAEKI
ncbi:twin-arginine translocation signal domain-containing protein [Dysgonomonas sp. 521]|uniref:enolase C-terminal domain-like protein n=1 Tax=Dysgonomonas sp. 521 TaxID=2302932 RepID=UPI0013D12C43|nr:enolase C-terminal domain-like protein [Dysgonomonas sp. 521]NDV94540.1 twin-arginine translocation signal domain-containing protein [Dysgonomonas sp. 521]